MGRTRRPPEIIVDPTLTERVLLVGVQFDGMDAGAVDRSLDELESLVSSAGGEVVGRVVQRRSSPDAATFIGKGKLQAIIETVGAVSADTTVFDEELSPAQLRNVEEAVPGKVIDRTILILDIFAQRAHSSEGKRQVELAQLSYGLPRLRGWGQALSRIGGAAGGGGGGRAPIGTRGPGETQLEIDRRRIERRLNKLRRDLAALERRRRVSRRHRRQAVPTVSLVGYTNAGKSTLLNYLTSAGVLVEDRLFSTLDPTARKLRLPSGQGIVLTDTVGFIRKIPHGLVEAFKSTLEEVSGADLLVHVVDASRADPDLDVAAVEEVLIEIEATQAPRLLAMNKVDLLPADQQVMLRRRFPTAIWISAATGEGVDDLLTAISPILNERVVEVEALVPFDQGTLLSKLHAAGRIASRTDTPEGAQVLVKARMSDLKVLAPYLTEPVAATEV